MQHRIAFGKKRRPTFFKQWRAHRGLSQEHLAERLDTSVASVSRIETGRQPYAQDLSGGAGVSAADASSVTADARSARLRRSLISSILGFGDRIVRNPSLRLRCRQLGLIDVARLTETMVNALSATQRRQNHEPCVRSDNRPYAGWGA
jgi:transcriptional regulator with XRE-family HTH domain